MDMREQKINELKTYPAAEEWYAFKDNWYNETRIAECVSALSDADSLLC